MFFSFCFIASLFTSSMYRGLLCLASTKLARCESERRPLRPRVVVVGAGLTGCLTAAMLRRWDPLSKTWR